MPTLEEIKATFAADRFATEVVGVEIQSAEPGHAVCALKLRPELMNAAGIPQGGAIFTLADFTFAVSANAYSDRISVSMQHDITYFAPARGKTLLAESRCVRCGRNLFKRSCPPRCGQISFAGDYGSARCCSVVFDI